MSRPKIILVDNPETKFSNIKAGETFIYVKVLFMKIRSVKRCDGKCNAIILASGDLAYIKDDADVTPVDIEIKVR